MSALVRILLLEDSDSDALLVERALRKAGIEFEFRRTASREGLARELEGFSPHVILSDFSMPGFGGVAALQMCRSLRPEVPYISVSGTLGEEAAVEMLKAGATDYVLKGQLTRLGSAVERALQEAAERVERLQAEEALRRSESRFRALYEHAGVGMAILGLDRLIHSCNPAFAAMLGQEEEAMRGAPLNSFMHPEDVPAESGLFEELARGVRDHYPVEKRYLKRNGEAVSGRAVISMVRDDDGEPLFAVEVTEDVTARKLLEDRLAHLEKMSALGRLAGGVAHDFNNFLTVILGFTELARGTPVEGPALRDMLGEVRKAGENARTLVARLLAFSRRQPRNPVEIDLNGAVRDAGAMLDGLLGRNVRVISKLDPALGPILADQGQMEQILVNLAVNARDAMPQGGALTIETKQVVLAEPADAWQKAVPPGGYSMLAVGDTGTGMDADAREHLFEPFFTTKPEGQGTGLGLSTVYGIVEQNKGYIAVESSPGEGTTFRIWLPEAGPR